MTLPTAVGGGVGVEQGLGAELCRRLATEGYLRTSSGQTS